MLTTLPCDTSDSQPPDSTPGDHRGFSFAKMNFVWGYIRCSNRAKMHPAIHPEAETNMPTYEYQCKDCRILFEKTLTLAAHEREPITCPKCGSLNVEQGFTTFYPVTSKKSA